MKLYLLNSDELREIVFENRNKVYGAYELRANYEKRVSAAMLIALSSVLIFGMLLFVLNKRKEFVIKSDVVKETPYKFDNIVIETPLAGQTTAHAPTPTQKTLPLENNYNVVKEFDKMQNTQVATTQSHQSEGKETGNTIGTLENSSESGNSETNTLSSETNAPYEIVELQKTPDFPGGLDKFYRYLSKNLHYTKAARMANLNSRVHVSFVIDAEGKINTVTIQQPIGYGMDEIVTDILRESPSWSPGIYNGQAVSTIIRLPINFQMLQ